MRKVEILPYDQGWSAAFASAYEELDAVLGSAAKAIHHIGSTSIPGLSAKPVIDILIETPDLTVIDAASPRLERLGYETRGEYGISGRRYFSRPKGRGPALHVHVFESGSDHLDRTLRFRDFLRAHPEEAARYARLKMNLAKLFAEDRESYQSGKGAFIRDVEERALEWKRRMDNPSTAHVR